MVLVVLMRSLLLAWVPLGRGRPGFEELLDKPRRGLILEASLLPVQPIELVHSPVILPHVLLHLRLLVLQVEVRDVNGIVKRCLVK